LEVEWDKIEEKPDKAHKVEGYYLLNQRAKIQELEKNLETERQARTEAEVKVASLEQKLQNTTDTLNANIKAQAQTIEEQKDYVSALEGEKEDILNQLREFKEKIDALEQDKTTLNTELSNLKGELDQVKNQIAEMQNKAESLENEKMQLMKENDELMQDLRSAEEKLEALEAEKNQLAAGQSQIGELQQQLQQKDQELQNLQNQLTQSTSEFNSLKQKVQTLESRPAAQPASPGPSQGLLESKPEPARPAFASESAAPAPTKTGAAGGWVCPKCEGTRVVEESDRSKILYVAAGRPIYGKKRRCLKCSYEWSV